MPSNLPQLMDPKFKFPDNIGGKVKFRDKHAGMTVTATGFPRAVVVMKCPDNQAGFFWKGDRNRPGYTKICDYLVFVHRSQTLHVFFCELKITADYEKAAAQMNHTKPLLQYIIAALEMHFNFKGTVKMHHVLFYEKENARWDKQGTHTGHNRRTPVEHGGIKIHRFLGDEVSFEKILAITEA